MYRVRDSREVLANQVKEIVCNALVSEGFIREKDAVKFCSEYAIVFREKGWFGKLIDEWFGKPSDGKIAIMVAKFIGKPTQKERVNPNLTLVKPEESK